MKFNSHPTARPFSNMNSDKLVFVIYQMNLFPEHCNILTKIVLLLFIFSILLIRQIKITHMPWHVIWHVYNSKITQVNRQGFEDVIISYFNVIYSHLTNVKTFATDSHWSGAKAHHNLAAGKLVSRFPTRADTAVLASLQVATRDIQSRWDAGTQSGSQTERSVWHAQTRCSSLLKHQSWVVTVITVFCSTDKATSNNLHIQAMKIISSDHQVVSL